MLEIGGGAERTGLYFTCINSYLSPEEVAYIVNDSDARVLISSAAKREVAAALPPLCPKVRRFLMVNQDGLVWQRNLGPKTAEVAAAITQFNPDSSWTPIPREGGSP